MLVACREGAANSYRVLIDASGAFQVTLAILGAPHPLRMNRARAGRQAGFRVSGERRQTAGVRILVADDERAVRDALRRVLRAGGDAVAVPTDGGAAPG